MESFLIRYANGIAVVSGLIATITILKVVTLWSTYSVAGQLIGLFLVFIFVLFTWMPLKLRNDLPKK